MAIRAKFVVTGYETTLQTPCQTPWNNGKPGTPVEMRTVKLTPVYGNGDPQHENTKFWNATPNGSISLGTINPEAWSQFELGKSYYIDFIRAPD